MSPLRGGMTVQRRTYLLKFRYILPPFGSSTLKGRREHLCTSWLDFLLPKADLPFFTGYTLLRLDISISHACIFGRRRIFLRTFKPRFIPQIVRVNVKQDRQKGFRVLVGKAVPTLFEHQSKGSPCPAPRQL